MSSRFPTSDQDTDREPLSGQVEKVVFHNPESGFAVLRVRLRGRGEPATVVGTSGKGSSCTIVPRVGVASDDTSATPSSAAVSPSAARAIIDGALAKSAPSATDATTVLDARDIRPTLALR